MTALTLKHPWVWAICRLGKRIENRTWQPPRSAIGRWHALHGGAPPKGRELERCYDESRRLIVRFGYQAPPGFTLRDTIMPGIVAVFRLSGVVTTSSDPWFEGPWGWAIDRLVMLPRPIACTGKLGLWPLSQDLLEQVRTAYREAA